jgi:hypothetical protein
VAIFRLPALAAQAAPKIKKWAKRPTRIETIRISGAFLAQKKRSCKQKTWDSPGYRAPAIALPSSCVLARPPMSRVRGPSVSTATIARTIASARIHSFHVQFLVGATEPSQDKNFSGCLPDFLEGII